MDALVREGLYQWVRPSQVEDFEANGWTVIGRYERFHIDSYLMYRSDDVPGSVRPGE